MMPFSAVRSFSVVSLKRKPLVDRLQHHFPALDGTLGLGRLDTTSREETYADIRAVNQRSQGSNGDGLSSDPCVWKKLDRATCNGPMLYVLGLRCPIRLVMVEYGPVNNHGRYIADALRDNPVPRLKLSVDHALDAAFSEMFAPNLAEKLTHLTLCLTYSNHYGFTSEAKESELTWDGVLDPIVSAIRPLHNLTHLHIVFGVSVYVGKNASWPFAPWDEYAHTFRPSRFDWEGTAATLACVLLSVRYVFLTTGGFLSNQDEPEDVEVEGGGGGRRKWYERWHVCHGWRVAKPGTSDPGASEGEWSLVKLHDDVAEIVIRNEGLILSEHDEGALHLNHGWGRTPPPSFLEDVRQRT